MSVFYTVHAPPLRGADASPDPERFVFVREGFYLWAFLAAALWMLWHQMWLVLLVYVVVAVGLDAALHYAGAPEYVIVVVWLLISLLIGIEAATLRRFTLARRGWKNVGVVGGHDREDAERRFFAAWVREATAKRPEKSTMASAPPPPVPCLPESAAVIGLFPEPGASR
ncbi:MAG TPA: DUF2628 domain-containing protein [Xanthobacteraceae bacterium]|nr:DUF2628 domain-containing protein [Xanthobacteraceae bacterium]